VLVFIEKAHEKPRSRRTSLNSILTERQLRALPPMTAAFQAPLLMIDATAPEIVIKFPILSWRSRQAQLYELDLPL
jgi:hypothetical protein